MGQNIDTSILNVENPNRFSVVIGLNRGLDSLVSAYLLKKQGFKVSAVSLVTWSKEDNLLGLPAPKCHVEDITFMQEICTHLGINFYAVNAIKQFQEQVVDSAYIANLTGIYNSACFNCSRLRLNILYDKMLKLNHDFFSVGYYAKIFKNLQSGEFYISTSNDQQNDQSAQLATIPQNMLSRLLLPLSELKKSEVFKIGSKFLPKKLISSNVQPQTCFPKEKIRDYIKEKSQEQFIRPGAIIFHHSESPFNEHDGVFNFSIQDELISDNNQLGHYRVTDIDYDSSFIRIADVEHSTFDCAFINNLELSKEVDGTRPLKLYMRTLSDDTFHELILYRKNLGCALLKIMKPMKLIRGDRVSFYKKTGKMYKMLGSGQVLLIGNESILNRVIDYQQKVDDEIESQKEDGKISNDKFQF